MKVSLCFAFIGGTKARIWRHAGHTDDSEFAGAPRFALKFAGHRCANISAAMEGLIRLRAACGLGQQRCDQYAHARVPATRQSGGWHTIAIAPVL